MNLPARRFPSSVAVNRICTDMAVQRILVVEGEGMMRLMLLHWLRLAGFRVDWARHESIATRKLRRSSPDVLLLGLPMRIEAVIQLIRLARQTEHFADRPIYLYAATNALNRALRKVVSASATRLLDRGTLAPEALVAAMVADLRMPGAAVASSGASASIVPLAPDASTNSQMLMPVAETPVFTDFSAVELNPHVTMKAKTVSSERVADIAVTPTEINAASESPHVRPMELRPGDNAGSEVGVPVRPLPAGVPAAGAAAARTILLVEDDLFIARAYRQQLERAGYSVESVVDGLQAVERLADLRPSLVILDLMLPKLHGLEVLKFARADVQLKSTPILVLSNAFMGGLVNKALAAGATQGMLKTECTPRKLLAVVSQLLAGSADSPAQVESDNATAAGEESALARARAELFADGPQEIAPMREDCLNYIRRAATPEATEHLNNLYRRVRCLGGRATLCGCARIGEFTSALEAVLFEMVFQTASPTDSILRTVAQAVDGLGRVLMAGEPAARRAEAGSRILVVDDDAVFTHIISVALKRAHLNVTCVQDPAASLQLMRTQPFDLVILDVDMPGMDGFDVCQELRQIPGCQTTQVIFVTMHTDLRNRARSIVVGGDDFIAKPVSPLELALKVTIHLLDPGSPNASPSAHSKRPAVRHHRTSHAVDAGEGAAAIPTPPVSENSSPRWTEPDTTLPTTESVRRIFESSDTKLGETADGRGEALSAQLAAADATAQRPEEAVQERSFRANELKAELSTLRAQHDALTVEMCRAQAEADQRIRELEHELQGKTAAFAARESELEATVSGVTSASAVAAAHTQMWRERSGRAEAELAVLRQAHEELRARTTLAQVQADERLAELAQQLDQRRVELEATGAQTQDAQSEARVWRSRCDELEAEATALRQAQAELQVARQQAANESTQRIGELETQLHTHTAESRVQLQALKVQLTGEIALKTRLDAQVRELNTRLTDAEKATLRAGEEMAQLRTSLTATEAAADAARAEAFVRLERLQSLETELAGLRCAHTELQAKDERALAEAGQRIGELERALAEATDSARQQLDATRRELAEANSTRERSEAVAQQLQSRTGLLETELTQLRNDHAGLRTRFERDRTESEKSLATLEKQSRQNLTAMRKKLEQARGESAEARQRAAALEKQYEQAQAELSEAAAAAKTFAADAEQWQARCRESEAGLLAWQSRFEELQSKSQRVEMSFGERVAGFEAKLAEVTAESGKELAALREELTGTQQARRELQTRLNQREAELSAATAQCQQAVSDAQTWQSRSRHLETEKAAWQNQHAGLLAQSQNAAAEASQRIASLEARLSQTEAESSQQQLALKQTLAETTRFHDHSQRELAKLKSELESAVAGRAVALAEAQTAQERSRHLEWEKQTWEKLQADLLARSEEIERAAGERIEMLEGKLHESATVFAAEMVQMQQRLRQGMAALAQAEVDLDGERSERQHAERARAELAQELERLHAELGRQVAAGREAQAELIRTTEQLQQCEGKLTQAAVDVQEATAGRQLVETQLQEARDRAVLLEERLSVADQAQRVLRNLQAEWENRIQASLSALHSSEARLAEEAAACNQLAARLESVHVQLAEAVMKSHRLETQLDAALKQTADLQVRWQQESGECQRLSEALAMTQLQLREQSQSSDIELTRLRSALEGEQLERQRLRNYTARLRCVTQAAAHAGRAVRDEARRQVRQPLEEVCSSVRRLLQMELAPDQNHLARQVLENALLARTNLHDEVLPPPAAPASTDVQTH